MSAAKTSTTPRLLTSVFGFKVAFGFLASLASTKAAVDDDMDVTQPNMLPSPESNQENSAVPAKKARGKRTAKFGKQKPAARKAAGTANGSGVKKAPAARKGQAAGRVPLKDQTNIQHGSDTEEVDEFNTAEDNATSKAISGDELNGAKPAPQQGRGRRPVKPEGPLEEHRPTIEDSIQVQRIVDEGGEFEYTPTQNRQSKTLPKPASRPRGRPKAPSKEPVVIPETQVEPLQIESSMPDPSPNSDVEEASMQPVQRTTHFRAGSKQRQPYRHRAGSASSTEGGRTANDPTLRRRLGDVTRKLESLEMKYQTLRDVGIAEASENFSRLQASAASERKAAAEVIASLKRDVAAQRNLAQEAKLLHQQLVTRDKDLESANAKANVLSANLVEAQNEIKALQARLSAQRNASSVVESIDAVTTARGGVPGSAVKNKPQQPTTRTIMVGSAEAAHQAQVAQLKEDLYADLTGLILRGVEQGDDGDVYDCIQTGRNGRALHFHLSLSTSEETSYDEAEFTYTPLLDADRDRDILKLMPDYLQDEIAFSRAHAAQFYGRVLDTLMRREKVGVVHQSVEGREDAGEEEEEER